MKRRLINSLILLFLFTISSSAIAQKCETVKDPFSGTEKKVYNHSTYNIFVFKMELEEDGSVIFSIRDADQKIIDTAIPAGTPFLFLLKGGEIIETALMEDVPAKSGSMSNTMGGTTFTEWIQKVKLTKEQVKLLAENKVTHLKFKRYDGSAIVFDSKKQKIFKMDKNLMSAAKCMLETK